MGRIRLKGYLTPGFGPWIISGKAPGAALKCNLPVPFQASLGPCAGMLWRPCDTLFTSNIAKRQQSARVQNGGSAKIAETAVEPREWLAIEGAAKGFTETIQLSFEETAGF